VQCSEVLAGAKRRHVKMAGSHRIGDATDAMCRSISRRRYRMRNRARHEPYAEHELSECSVES